MATKRSKAQIVVLDDNDDLEYADEALLQPVVEVEAQGGFEGLRQQAQEPLAR